MLMCRRAVSTGAQPLAVSVDAVSHCSPANPRMLNFLPVRPWLWLLLALASAGGGCHRGHYRLSADRDAYDLTAQKNALTRDVGTNYSIEVDPRSRMYDPFDPDREPMPPDDPASHAHMHWIDGMHGWKKWHHNGDTPFVENPNWRMFLCLDEDGCLVLSSDEAYRLARLNSRDYQSQLEELYLSALDVSFERFRFDSQFFFSKQTEYTSIGGDGGSSSLLEDAQQIRLEKMFASGGDLMVELANSLVWEFSGENTFTPTVLGNFLFVQPLLRNGGKARVLERLTISERTLLANVRQMERFRRGFYVEIMTGQDAGAGPSRRGGVFGGAGLEGFTGVGGGGFGRLTGAGNAGFGGGGAGAGQAGGYMGLLQEQQNIRNLEFNVAGLQSNLARLRAIAEAEHPEPAQQLRAQLQVEQAEQALYSAQSRLLNAKLACQSNIDEFKINLGLPPQLCVKVRDPMLDRFVLIDNEIITLQNRLAEVQRQMGRLLVQIRRDADSENETLAWKDEYEDRVQGLSRHLQQLQSARQRLNEKLDELEAAGCREAIEQRRKRLTRLRERYRDKPLGSLDPCLTAEGEKRLQSQVRALLDTDYMDQALREIEGLRRALRTDLQRRERTLAGIQSQLRPLLERGPEMTPEEIYEAFFGAADGGVLAERRGVFQMTDVVADLSVDVLELSLAGAKQRAMCIDLTPVDLDPPTAFEIARANRRDWMNARASLVDTWRLIEFNANDLKSRLDVVFEGDFEDVGDFTTGRLQARLELDAPLQRVAERNTYRQALIEYQQARRNYYAFTDQVARSLRSELRALEVNEINFEARRRAVLAAIDQVITNRLIQDQPAAPGEVREIGVTAARDAVSALTDLLNAQNDFLSVWVSYEVLRRAIDRDLGTMQLDFEGYWIDPGPINAETGFVMPPECADCRLETELFGPPPAGEMSPHEEPSPEELPAPDPLPEPPAPEELPLGEATFSNARDPSYVVNSERTRGLSADDSADVIRHMGLRVADGRGHASGDVRVSAERVSPAKWEETAAARNVDAHAGLNSRGTGARGARLGRRKPLAPRR